MPYYQDYQKKNNSRAAKREWTEERPRGQKRGYHSDERREDKPTARPGRDDRFARNSQKTDHRPANGQKPTGRYNSTFQKSDAPRRSPNAPVRTLPRADAAPAERPRRPMEAAPAPRPRKPIETPHAGFDTPYTREPENLLSGRNPIREALKADRDIEKMLVAKGDLSGSAREIVAMARERGIPVQVVERSRLDEITPHHQGILAYASAYQYAEGDYILALAKERGEQPFVVVLDGITDPHNLGAIIRTASCAGAHGVIVPLRRSVGLTPAAVKASAGAVETVKVARVTNLTQTLRKLKQAGLWIYAADMSGEDYRDVKLEMPMALVIGSEGEGISRLVLENADFCVKLPLLGAVDSLNASVAAGILMYHAAFAAKK